MHLLGQNKMRNFRAHSYLKQKVNQKVNEDIDDNSYIEKVQKWYDEHGNKHNLSKTPSEAS